MGRAVAAALAAVLVQGCFATHPAPTGLPATLPTAEQIVDAMRARRQQLTALRTLARVRYESPAGTENARNVLAVERPDRFRFEVVSLLGSLLVMTSDGGRFTAYLPRESTVYRGAASAENLDAYLPIAVSIPTIIDHILATPQLLEGGRAVVTWDEGLICLTQIDDDGGAETCFRDLATPATYREVNRDGRTTIEARYEDIDDTGIVPIATQVTVRFPATKESLVISMRGPEVNPSFPDDLFSLKPPPKTREVDLDHARSPL